jgi:uncharacterized protein YecA (UPF0149 family)
MDSRDGRIYVQQDPPQWEKMDAEYMKEMAITPTPFQRAEGRVRRNDPCPCGSRKKFKRCCLALAR